MFMLSAPELTYNQKQKQGGKHMTDKPKRKRHQPQSHPLLKLFQAHPVEFLSPLTVKECARRLQARRTIGKKQNRLDVYITRRSPGSYKFWLERSITRRSQRGGDYQEIVRADGELSYWDEESTLVTCRPRMGWQTWLWFGAFVGLPLALLITALIAGDTGELFRGIAAAVALPIGFAVWLVGRAHEHRRLVKMVEEILRDPIFY